MTAEQKPLYSAQRIRTVMQEAGLTFQKKFGQNFLIDGNLVRKIVEGAQIGSQDVVLEIGPGIGTLTEALLSRAEQVIAIEVDAGLWPVLEKNFIDFSNFTLVKGDALQCDLAALLREHAPGRRVKVVANLPYYITTPLLRRLLQEDLPVEAATLMVQKEVAERITAAPSTKEYGSLTLFLALYAQTRVLFSVPRSVFLPPPKVDSAVVHLVPKPASEGMDRARLAAWIQVGFQQRRKTVLNALSRGEGVNKSALREALDELEISPRMRVEDLRLEDFVALAARLF